MCLDDVSEYICLSCGWRGELNECCEVTDVATNTVYFLCPRPPCMCKLAVIQNGIFIRATEESPLPSTIFN